MSGQCRRGWSAVWDWVLLAVEVSSRPGTRDGWPVSTRNQPRCSNQTARSLGSCSLENKLIITGTVARIVAGRAEAEYGGDDFNPPFLCISETERNENVASSIRYPVNIPIEVRSAIFHSGQ